METTSSVGAALLRGVRRVRRPLLLRAAVVGATGIIAVGVVAGCVQSPVANSVGGRPVTSDAAVQGYQPDVVPVVVPSLNGAPDVSSVPVDEATSGPDDAGTTPTSGSQQAQSQPTSPTTQAPAATKAAPTQAAQAPQTTQAAAPATTAVAAPAQPATTAAKTTADTQSLVGPGRVELKCYPISNGKTRATLKWDNPGFAATLTVNGKTVKLSNTNSTSLGESVSETTSGHGTCTAVVGTVPAMNSY